MKIYQYSSDSGATMTLTYDAANSGASNPAYTYKIENVSCGTQSGSLILSKISGEIIVDYEFAGAYPSGLVNQMVWMNAPVCGKVDRLYRNVEHQQVVPVTENFKKTIDALAPIGSNKPK